MSDAQDNEPPGVTLPSADPPGAREGPEPRKPAQEVEGVEGGAAVTVEVDEDSPPQKIEGHRGGEPVKVEFDDEPSPPPPRLIRRDSNQTLAPKTTEAEDEVSKGQRKTAWLWEMTQAITAIVVTTIAVVVLAWLALFHPDPSPNQLVAALQLNVMATLILANYFARTNHVKGGSGEDFRDKYRGR